MKTLFNLLLAVACLPLPFSCKKAAHIGADPIPASVVQQIKNMGYSIESIVKIEEGYIVEGDILLRNEEVAKAIPVQRLRAATTEQYRTTNLVTQLPLVCQIRMSPNFPSRFLIALQQAVNRYNGLNLRLQFSHTAPAYSGPGITFLPGTPPLSYTGGPSGGLPAKNIYLDYTTIMSTNSNYLTTIVAHEIGHAIGFRHTDYMNRVSCNPGFPQNEGFGVVGAVHIPGTPTSLVDPSWMVACIPLNTNLNFTASDTIALRTLYQ